MQTDNPAEENAELNAAHFTLPVGTYVDVRHSKKTVQLQINDRQPQGPVANNIIELSVSAADRLGLQNSNEVNCYIRIPFWVNHPVLKQMAYFLGAGAFVSTLILFNNLDLYL